MFGDNDQKLSKKKQDFLLDVKSSQEDLEKKWQAFLEKDTYFIFENKNKFLKELKQITKSPLRYKFDLKFYSKIRGAKKKLRKLKKEIEKYNDSFIKNRLKEYSSFFEGKDDNLEYPLDEDQRIAIIKDDKHNLVVAGAGSGKTSVITSRIAYLIRRKDKIQNDKRNKRIQHKSFHLNSGSINPFIFKKSC